MRTTLNINAVNKKNDEQDEPIETRLARLAATCKDRARAVTDAQRYWYEQATVPYETMDPMAAFVAFASLVKTWVLTSRVGNSLTSLVAKSSITLNQTTVYIHDPVKAGYALPKIETTETVTVTKSNEFFTVNIVSGDIKDAMTRDQAMARDVSNILSLYTSCEKIISPTTHASVNKIVAFTNEQCKAAKVYMLNLGPVREFWPVVGPSNIETRNAMYVELTCGLSSSIAVEARKSRALIYYLMDAIASQFTYHTLMPQECVDLYNANKPDPRLPDKAKLCCFSYSAYRKISTTSHEDAWMSYLTSRQLLGGSKTNILSGYSIIDSLPGLASRYEEAMDILNCAYLYGYSAVRLLQADIVLSQLLVDSQMIVICQSNGRGMATDKPGIYAATDMKTMNWVTIRQKSPENKGGRVAFPPPSEFYMSDSFGYEYVPDSFQDDFVYFPSMRSADGYCIKSNVPAATYKFTCADLISRFSLALYTRNQYVFTRVTFPQVDPMKTFFVRGVVLRSRAGEEKSVEGLEELIARHDALSFSDSEKNAWDTNGVKLAPFLLDATMKSVFKDTEVTGTRQTRTERMAVLSTTAKKLKETNTHKQLLEIFWEYATTNTVKDPALLSVIASCSKAEVIGTFAAEWQWTKRVAWDKFGTCTWTDKTFWRKQLERSPAQPPPLPTITDPPPSTAPPVDSSDPYQQAATYQLDV